jgi:hypothetical protein
VEERLTQALVRTILEHAEDYPWRMQDIGLLGVTLDDRKEFRLHVWDPTCCDFEDDPPIHDHPYDFTSTIIAGEMTNTRYEEDQAGTAFTRFRFAPGNERGRTADTVHLSGVGTTYTAGGRYQQLAHELHDSRQLPGTVSVIRCTFRDPPFLTVCRQGPDWVTGQSRAATSEEVKTITCKALQWFEPLSH